MAHIVYHIKEFCLQEYLDLCLLCRLHIWKPVHWENPKNFQIFHWKIWIDQNIYLLILCENGPNADQSGKTVSSSKEEENKTKIAFQLIHDCHEWHYCHAIYYLKQATIIENKMVNICLIMSYYLVVVGLFRTILNKNF